MVEIDDDDESWSSPPVDGSVGTLDSMMAAEEGIGEPGEGGELDGMDVDGMIVGEGGGGSGEGYLAEKDWMKATKRSNVMSALEDAAVEKYGSDGVTRTATASVNLGAGGGGAEMELEFVIELDESCSFDAVEKQGSGYCAGMNVVVGGANNIVGSESAKPALDTVKGASWIEQPNLVVADTNCCGGNSIESLERVEGAATALVDTSSGEKVAAAAASPRSEVSVVHEVVVIPEPSQATMEWEPAEGFLSKSSDMEIGSEQTGFDAVTDESPNDPSVDSPAPKPCESDDVDLVKLCGLLEKNNVGSDRIAGKDVLLLLGNTGSGKTSTLLHLCGVQFAFDDTGAFDHFEPVDVPAGLADFKVASGPTSVTKTMQVVEASVDGEGLVICDVPGLSDTSGIEAEIANQKGVVAALRKAKSVRPVLVVNLVDLSTGRCKPLSDALDTYNRMFKQDGLPADFAPFRYVFTRCVRRDAKRVHLKMICFQSERCAVRCPDQVLSSFVQDMIDKTCPSALFVDLEEGNSVELLRALWKGNSSSITDPSLTFSDSLTKTSADKLNLQMHSLLQCLDIALHGKDFTFVAAKFALLDRISVIIPDTVAFRTRGMSSVMAHFRNLAAILFQLAHAMLDSDDGGFASHADKLKMAYDDLLLFVPVLVLGEGRIDSAVVSCQVRLLCDFLITPCVKDVAEACEGSVLNAAAGRATIERSLSRLQTLHRIFRDTEPGKASVTALSKCMDRGVAWVDQLLSGVAILISEDPYHCPVLVAEIGANIGMADTFSEFLVAQEIVKCREDIFFARSLDLVIRSLRDAEEKAKNVLCGFVTACQIDENASDRLVFCEEFDFELFGHARAFLLSLLAYGGHWYWLHAAPLVVQDVVDNFDHHVGPFFAQMGQLCKNSINDIAASDVDLPTKKSNTDLLERKVLAIRRACKACEGWHHFVGSEIIDARDILLECRTELTLLNRALTAEAQELVKGIRSATLAAETMMRRLRNGDEETGILLMELCESQNWDYWCSLVNGQQLGAMSGIIRWAQNLFGMTTMCAELEGAQEALIGLVHGRICNACLTITQVGMVLSRATVATALLSNKCPSISAIQLLSTLVRLPTESALLKRLFAHKGHLVLGRVLCAALDALNDSITLLKSTPDIYIECGNYEDLASILTLWKDSERLEGALTAFCTVDPPELPQLSKLQKSILPWPTYDTLQADAITQLVKLEKDVTSLSFKDMLDCVNEDSRQKFYRDVAGMLAACQSARAMGLHVQDKLPVLELYSIALRKVEGEINALKHELKSLCLEFLADRSRFNRIYALNGNLQSICNAFEGVQSTFPRLSSEYRGECERAAKDALQLFVSKGSSLCFGAIVDALVLLKTASREIPCWHSLIDASIDRLIGIVTDDFNDTDLLFDLSLLLQQRVGCDDTQSAQQLLSDHKCFVGIGYAAFNQATAGQDIAYVLKGLGLATEKSEQLQLLYEDFEKSYIDLIQSHFIERRYCSESDTNEKSIAAETNNFSEIAQAAIHLSTNALLQYSDQVVALSSHLFAYWTLESSNGFALSKSDTRYLMKPHPAQVVAVWTMLNVTGKDGCQLANHLLELKTGEGKSVVLGITAVILALFGYDVNCICYSRYLSERDIAAFQRMFCALQVETSICYGTFKDLYYKLLGPYYALAESEVSGHIGRNRPSVFNVTRPRVLLIDEVDVFFGPDSFGSFSHACLTLQSDAIMKLFRRVWDHPASFTAISILETADATDVIYSFPPHARPLIRNEITKLISHACHLKAGYNKQYILSDGQIGYKEFDGLDFSIGGYSCYFAYMKELDEGNVTDAMVRAKVGLCPLIGGVSYAEMPYSFDVILGVTGTLASLSEAERCALEDKYGITKQSYIPSVFGDNRLNFAMNSSEDVVICKSKEDHFLELKHEIFRRRDSARHGYEEVERAIMVFFDSKETLLDFFGSSYMHAFKTITRTITETAALEERTSLFQKATCKGAITLMIRDFGRGTDFQCHDKALLQAGGIHVIQAFFSADASEEIQIKGRCARQGANGSFSMVINAEQLKSDLRLSRREIDDIRNDKYRWQRLDEKRTSFSAKNFAERLAAVDVNEEMHYRSQECLTAMAKGTKKGEVISFFEELNGLTRSDRAFAGGAKQIKSTLLEERRLRLALFHEKLRRQREDDVKDVLEDIEQLKIEASIQQTEMARVRTVLIGDNPCHFKLLGVDFDAPMDAVEKSYRILAIIFHPDKCEEADAQSIFLAIGNARDVLVDDNKRTEYVRQRRADDSQEK